MGERQRTMFRSRRLVIDEVITASHSILAGRARQVIRLHGYRNHFNLQHDSPVTGDTSIALAVLQTIDRDWGLRPDDYMGPTAAKTIGQQMVIDIAYDTQEETIVTSGFLGRPLRQGDWVNCNLLVPEVALYLAAETGDTVGLANWVVLEYEWEDVDLGKLAAVNLAWGRDAGDFDRS